MKSQRYNFCSGPATLPHDVLLEASQAIVDAGAYGPDGAGLSILELSHRGGLYERIHQETRALLLELLGLDPRRYTALVFGGGASLQFAMVPLNFLGARTGSGEPGIAEFVHTGEWSKKAIAEASRLGEVRVVASSEADRFARLPIEPSAVHDPKLPWSGQARYAHLTSNNTIEGTEWAVLPDTGATPLVVDASSNLLSRAYDHSRASLIYAGAQKNLGPAGATFVIVEREFLAQASEAVPSMLSYRVAEQAAGLYNTPPVYAVFVSWLVLKWLKREGGVAALEPRNVAKADLIYAALDAHPEVYECVVREPAFRSRMNIPWRLRQRPGTSAAETQADERRWLEFADTRFGLVGLAGHRSVGGLRASIYNAMPHEGCERLAECLHAFAQTRLT